MRRGGRIKPEYGPAQVFVFTIGDALLAIREADMDPNPREYHAACNHFLGVLVAEEIGYYKQEWFDWQKQNFKDDYGRPLPPGASLKKRHRRQELARAVAMLREKGVLGRAAKEFSRDEDILSAAMEDDEAED